MANPNWRGVAICLCMTAPLVELARISGADILVRPIPGFGSFQQGETASAGTGSGGGHVDLDLTRLDKAQKLRLEGLARRVGFYADIREPTWWSPTRKKWLKQRWQSHLHMVLKSCPHLSREARDQLDDWFAGGNGLAGDDPDDGDRTFLRQTWAGYQKPRPAGGSAPAAAGSSVIDPNNVRIGKRNNDVKRYQAAVWRSLSKAAQAAILARHHFTPAQLLDGNYGTVTIEMTQALYRAIAAAEPKAGWPVWKQPGNRLLQRLGFIPRASSKDPDAEHLDEFGEPDVVTDPEPVIVDR